MSISRKILVADLLKSIETGNPQAVSVINPTKYIQHNLNAADGLEGFSELMKQLPPGSAKVHVIRIFEDGDYVFAHTKYNFFGPKIGFDIFRFEDAKIVEHWDNLQAVAKPNPDHHTMIDGAVEIYDLDKTVQNKELIKNFIEEILLNGQIRKISGYFNGDNYIQHNPLVPDKLSGLGKTLGEWAKEGKSFKYEKLHMLLGEGNFVLAAGEGEFHGAKSTFYDLFRVENNKIAEHWDVIEPLLPESEWKNNNGKF